MYGKNWILKIWRTYKRNVKYKRRYTEHQELLKTIEVKQEDEKKERRSDTPGAEATGGA